MWAIGRASIPFRSRSHRVVVACCLTPPELRSGETESRAVGASVLPGKSAHGFSLSATAGRRNLSSQAGEKSSDAEERFSDLEVPPPEADQIENVVDDPKSEEEDPKSEEEDDAVISDGDEEAAVDGSLGLLEADAMFGEKGAEGKSRSSADSPLFKSLMEPDQTVDAVLKKWTKEGRLLGRSEIMVAMLELRRRRLFAKALQFMEWLVKNKCVDFIEGDYAFHLDLIAKVHGLLKAELFLYKVPDSFRGEVVYRTLLANCVSRGDNVTAERVFNRIRALFPITTFVCNQMLLLYKRTDPKRITRILNLMEEEDIQPSLFTYKLLIDTKGRAKDVKGMEEIIEMMKSKGMEPDLWTQAMVARHYISGCHSEKAEAILKEIEGEEDIKNNRCVCRLLLPLYASLGKDAEVGRIWKACKDNRGLEYLFTAIKSWSARGKVEVGKADAITWKPENHTKLLYNTYLTMMEKYAQRGDVPNAEKIFYKLKQSGCVESMEQSGYAGWMKQYQTLLQAYINSKRPAYGIRERMKADNILLPDGAVEQQLKTVDGFNFQEPPPLAGTWNQQNQFFSCVHRLKIPTNWGPARGVGSRVGHRSVQKHCFSIA